MCACPQCGKQFKNSRNVAKHVKYIHQDQTRADHLEHAGLWTEVAVLSEGQHVLVSEDEVESVVID
jgi:hypothetical protein